jgi:hypothetical protein
LLAASLAATGATSTCARLAAKAGERYGDAYAVSGGQPESIGKAISNADLLSLTSSRAALTTRKQCGNDSRGVKERLADAFTSLGRLPASMYAG